MFVLATLTVAAPDVVTNADVLTGLRFLQGIVREALLAGFGALAGTLACALAIAGSSTIACAVTPVEDRKLTAPGLLLLALEVLEGIHPPFLPLVVLLRLGRAGSCIGRRRAVLDGQLSLRLLDGWRGRTNSWG